MCYMKVRPITAYCTSLGLKNMDESAYRIGCQWRGLLFNRTMKGVTKGITDGTKFNVQEMYMFK